MEQASLFSNQVIVPICDHFFDGVPENRPLLEQIYAAFPKVLFVEYPFIPHRIPKKIFAKIDPAHFWHSLSRLIGASALEEGIEMVLFLDADEIPEAARFIEWLGCSDYQLHTVLKFANYWYFREARYQAEIWEDSPVFVQRRALDPPLLLCQEEREAIYDSLPGPKRRMVVGVDGKPMLHHYSWVRTEEEMLRKVRAWGHREDRDWETLIRQEFSSPFKGTDFVHGYRFQTVEPAFKIDFILPLFSPNGKGSIRRLKEKEVLSLINKVRERTWGFFGLDF